MSIEPNVQQPDGRATSRLPLMTASLYEAAVEAVDALAEAHFPVERVAIIRPGHLRLSGVWELPESLKRADSQAGSKPRVVGARLASRTTTGRRRTRTMWDIPCVETKQHTCASPG